jgi:VCBS repeat-containing protein
LTEGNGSLIAYGTLTVSDLVARNVVTTEVTGVMFASPSPGQLTTADVLGFLTATSRDTSKTSSAKVDLVFNSGAQKFDFLAQGEVLSLIYTVTASNGKGGTASYTFTVLITGTNDGPTLMAGEQNTMLIEASDIPGSGNAGASIPLTWHDVDGVARFDPAAAGWTTPDGGVTYRCNGTYGIATLDMASRVVTYRLDNTRDATQALAQGAIVHDDFTVQVTDGLATASAAVRFSITGTNDAPTVMASTPSATLVEAGQGSGEGTSSASISLTSFDVDSVARVNEDYLAAQGWTRQSDGFTYTREGTYGTASLDTTTRVVSYLLDNTRSATDALALGDTVTDDFTVQVTDGAATASTVARFTIMGVNEIPVVEPIIYDGTDGDDTFTGAVTNDWISGGLGDDTLYGAGGDDVILGGEGHDFLTGDDGNDELYGGAGNDTLYGGFGADILRGGPGNDVIYAGDGENFKQIAGDAGSDTLTGGAGRDGFEFRTAPVAGEVDSIVNFDPSKDLISISAKAFAFDLDVQPRALKDVEFAFLNFVDASFQNQATQNTSTRIVANQRDAQLIDVYYDPNGVDLSDATLFATLTLTGQASLEASSFQWIL